MSFRIVAAFQNMGKKMSDSKIIHMGGCHCGNIRFKIKAPSVLTVLDCNCSICSKIAFLHLIVGREDFSLLSGQEHLTSYSFNTRTAQHLFCNQCGVKSFYIPRSHPSSYSVNARCLDNKTWTDMKIAKFDGLNWESAISTLNK